MPILSPLASRRRRRLVAAAFAVVSCGAVVGCGENDPSFSPPQFAVLSAFPAELAPHVQQATITRTVMIDGHVFRVGTLDGVHVVLALTGIGLVNAANTTRTLLEQFDVQGIVVSAVAGTKQLQIGDVSVPLTWHLPDGSIYAADQGFLALAEEIASSGAAPLERCTLVPSESGDPVCFPKPPVVAVGGFGLSSDRFGGMAFPCIPGGGDVNGCDVDLTASTAVAAVSGHTLGAPAPAATPAEIVDDMETAAIAREATARGVPFIAFRAVSDGTPDPLGLSGFLTQFNAYYPFAARNAAHATVTFLKMAALTSP